MTCFEDAKSEKMAKLVPLTAQSQEAVKKIEAATAAIASLEPILENLRERTDKLTHKIDEELVPECFEADEVSEMLTKIREMILALEECPGRSDFALKIPKVTPKGPAPIPAAKAKEAVAEAVEEKKDAVADAVEEKKDAVEEKKEAVADAVEEKKEAVADAVE